MKLKDLKNGMRIVVRNKSIFVVFENINTRMNGFVEKFFVKFSEHEDEELKIILSRLYDINIGCGFMGSNKYNEDMLCPTDKAFDIMKVLYPRGDIFFLSRKLENMDLIWERNK